MIKKSILSILLCCVLFAEAEPPKYEIRAAWLTTAFRLDWPTTLAKDTLSATKQRREFVKIVELLHFLNFNTVFLQVRLRNDAIFESKTEPWSAMISGKSGKNPGYDALRFAIEECHKRGLECHAWMVTIPIGTDNQTKANGIAGLVKTHPELCKRIKGEWFLDPGMPETATYIANIASEITRNYDIDGIHLDYLRYPEIGEFPDEVSYRKAGNGLKKSDWRRANINRIEATIYDSVKALKPWVQVSASPIGKRDDLDSISSHGWNGRSRVFQDVKYWFSNNKIDFVSPMLYFKEPIYKPFLKDWVTTADKKPISAGIALYMLTDRNWPLDIIQNEIDYSREINCGGQTYFRVENLMRNTKGCTDLIKQKYYTYPALLPAMKWLDSIAPASPIITETRQENNSIILEWKCPSEDKNLTFNLYADSCKMPDTGNIKKLLACRIPTNRYEMEIPDDLAGQMYFYVTANDRFHNESKPSLPVSISFDPLFLKKKLSPTKN